MRAVEVIGTVDAQHQTQATVPAEVPHSYDSRTSWTFETLKMTMIYTYVLNRGGRGIFSPMDHPNHPRSCSQG